MKLLLGLLALLMITACMSNYYNQYGGYPFDSKEFIIKENKANIKLIASSRYINKYDVIDSTQFNVSIKIVVPKEDLTYLKIEKLTLKANDESYLYVYKNPAVYDTFGRFPIQNTGQADSFTESSSSDNLCIFTISNAEKDYQILLTYKVMNSQGEFETFEKTLPLVVTENKTK